MKNYARIEGGTVAEILSADSIAGRFHPSLVWVECGAGVLPGWSYDGATFAPPAPAALVIPSSVSPAQARLALYAAGLLPQVEAIVANADATTKIAWNSASVIERASPTVAALSAALGLGAAQLDALFTAAAAIRV